MVVYDKIVEQNRRYSLYDIRRTEYKNDVNDIPFRVSPMPFKLKNKQKDEIISIGPIICQYLQTVIELYFKNEVVKEILDRNKSSLFLKNAVPNYLFIRPDLILTPDGFKICELETSVFGLALSEILNRAYVSSNFETIVPEGVLGDYINSQLPSTGKIVFSDRVKAFKGQLNFLAEQVFSSKGKIWTAEQVSSENNYADIKAIYRAFYSSDSETESAIADLIANNSNFVPSLTPQFEEKAILSFIWDKRFQEYFKKSLGNATYSYLKRLIPPTFIIGEEVNFELGMPNRISDIMDLANLPKSKRHFVIKKSGDSSWGEGIMFLHKVSHEKAFNRLKEGYKELTILQEFNEGSKFKLNYLSSSNEIESMNAKIRLTPYYAFAKAQKGKLIAIKATGCENTDYIHGATNSINTSVM